LFSNQYLFYNDLFFRVLSISNIENKVSVKYITKNIKTDWNDVFLVTTNQKRAKTISSRNLSPIETRLCIVWLSASFVCPLKKIIRIISVISEKAEDNMAISVNKRLRQPEETIK